MIPSITIGGGNVNPAAVTQKDVLGNFWVVGTVTGADAYFPTPTWGASGSDIFAVQFDSSGGVLNKFRFGTSADDFANAAVAVGTSVEIGGSTKGAFVGFSNAGQQDAFVLRYSSTSGQDFTYQQGTAADDVVRGLTQVGNVIGAVGSTGGVLEAATFGATGGGDGFVWVIDNVLSVKTFGALVGSASFDVLRAITGYDINNHVYLLLAGSTYGSQWGANPLNSEDGFLVKFSVAEGTVNAREFRWAWQSAGNGDESIFGVVLDDPNTGANQPGYVHLVGRTSGDFPAGTAPLGGADGFRVRMTAF